MFRIAHQSHLPFHGKISVNDINLSYFAHWNNGIKPTHATVYPVVLNKKVHGFIVGFDKGPVFDLISTLTKISHLMTLSQTALENLSRRKAA